MDSNERQIDSKTSKPEIVYWEMFKRNQLTRTELAILIRISYKKARLRDGFLLKEVIGYDEVILSHKHLSSTSFGTYTIMIPRGWPFTIV